MTDKRLAGGPMERVFIHELTYYLNSAGDGLQSAKNPQAALAFYEKALADCDKRLKLKPDDIRFLLDSGASHYRIGLAKLTLKLPREAIAHLEKVRSIFDAVSDKEALSAEANKTLARSYHYAGLAWAALGNPVAAREAVRTGGSSARKAGQPASGGYWVHTGAGQRLPFDILSSPRCRTTPSMRELV